jgi:hypothetical protein
LAASPTAHRLECLDTAGAVLKDPIRIEDGHAIVPEGPGIGLEWDEEAVGRYLVRREGGRGSLVGTLERRGWWIFYGLALYLLWRFPEAAPLLVAERLTPSSTTSGP